MIYGITAAASVVVFALAVSSILRVQQSRKVVSRMTTPTSGGFGYSLSHVKLRWPVSQQKYEKTLPITLDLVVRSLYSGAGFVQALRDASVATSTASALDLQRVVQEIDLGESVGSALFHWRNRVPYDSVVVCVAAMTLAFEVGANLAVAVDSAAAAVRRTLEAAATAKTNATQSRSSAAALVFLPLVVSGPLILFNTHARDFMLGTFVGLALLACGLTLDVLGWLWMKSMVKRALA